MDDLDIFQAILKKKYNYGWWGLERISEDAGTHITSTELQEKFQTRGVWLMLADPEHQEMNGQVKVSWRTVCTIVHLLMEHA